MSVAPGEVLYLPAGRWIRNVRWSSDDPHPTGYYSWIGLWHTIIGTSPESCCVCDRSVPSIIGGHVILGEGFKYWNEAANNNNSLKLGNRVFIAPICKRCNAKGNNPLPVKRATAIVQLYEYQGYEEHIIVQPPATQVKGKLDSDDVNYAKNGCALETPVSLQHSGPSTFASPARPSGPSGPSVPGWSTATPRMSQATYPRREWQWSYSRDDFEYY